MKPFMISLIDGLGDAVIIIQAVDKAEDGSFEEIK